jgi:hypothetical protein
MPRIDRDPIHALKAFLRTGKSESAPTLAESIRTIKARLARARKVNRRISLSEALLAHLAGE